MTPDSTVTERFHRTLVEEIHRHVPEYLERPFTVAEIYQSLVPYRTHRDRIGVELNGDYEDVLLRLLAGEGGYLVLDSEPARERIHRELQSSNPNTGLYREFAAVEVRLNPEKLPTAGDGSDARSRDGDDRLQTSLDSLSRKEVDPPGEKEGLLQDLESLERDAEPPVEEGAVAPGTGAGGGPPEADGPEPELPSRCPECEEALPPRENLRFCPFCGTNVFVVSCGKCGEVLERRWRFCVACGTPAEG